jgi:hypothetical protein
MEIRKGSEGRIGRKKSLATIGTRGSAVKRKRIVEDSMSVTSVVKPDTRERSVGRLERVPKRPRYLQHSVWAEVGDTIPFSPTAASTISDEPLPRPPSQEFDNLDAIITIDKNPDLFV